MHYILNLALYLYPLGNIGLHGPEVTLNELCQIFRGGGDQYVRRVQEFGPVIMDGRILHTEGVFLRSL